MQPDITLPCQSKHLVYMWSRGDEIWNLHYNRSSRRIYRDHLFRLLQRTTMITCVHPFRFCFVKSNTQEKGMKFALPNSLMHDTNKHNFYVRQPHFRRMEYVRKTLSRRHFNKLEAVQARHHMKIQPKSLYQIRSV